MAQELSRRDFLKGSALLGSAAALTGLAGCAPQESATGEALATDTGYMNAAKYAQKWVFEVAPEPIGDSQIVETIEADLVVIGAGTSGLTTANAAAEEGLKVVLISASEAPVSRGGSNNAIYSKAMKALGLPKTSPKEIEKEIFFSSHKVDAKRWYKFYNSSEMAMDWAIDLMAEAGYEAGVEAGSLTVDSESLYYVPPNAHGWMSAEQRAPGMGQPFYVNYLAERLGALGGEVYFKTIGRQLIRGDVPNGTDGRVTGIIAEHEDGTFTKYVGTKAVVLATGDFSADREMMTKYAPQAVGLVNSEVFDNDVNYDAGFQYGGIYKGDGHKMGLWVGAAWQKTYPNCPMAVPVISPGPQRDEGAHWGLLVDRHGERFMNEYICTDVVATMTEYIQDKGSVFAIWDTSYATHTGQVTKGLDEAPSVGEGTADGTPEEIIANWEFMVEQGAAVKGATVEEVISQLGLPPATIDTVDRYNKMARTGEDTEYYKEPSRLQEIIEGPFYGQASSPGTILTILGGLRTNANQQVCDADDNPLPGLYNVGTMSGDMFAGTYSFMSRGVNLGMNCLTFGYLTGKYIAANE
jgi:succinate dehydrogenase/fumarate reductase flavoprotein subunit